MPRSKPSSTSEPEAHSRIGPSASGRWLRCRASVGFIEKNRDRIPKDQSSPHADEGTAAHKLARLLLTGRRVVEGDWDEDMRAHIELFVRHVRTKMSQLLGAKLYVEQKIPLYYDTTQEGTADVVLLSPSTAAVVDLKYGEGVSVEAVKNSQLTIYLKSWIKHHRLNLKRHQRLELEIYQPRAQDSRFVRKWETTVAELDEYAAEIEEVAKDIIADPDNQPFYPDEKLTCRWCPAKGICEARAKAQFKDLPSSTAILERPKPGFPVPGALKPAQVSKVLQHAAALRKWLNDVEEYAAALHREGNPPPLTKFVLGRGSRDWSDPDAAGRLLARILPREDVYPSSLISPAQAEARLKKGALKAVPSKGWHAQLDALISKTPGNPVLVHASDPRPAVTPDGQPLLTEEDRLLL